MWDEARTSRLTELRAKGWTFGEIANELGVSRSTAIGKANRLGMLGRKPRIQKLAKLPRVEKHRKPAICRPIAFRGPPIAPAEMPRATADDIARVSLIDLEPHHCRWPCGEPTAGFCGCPKVPGSSYCEGHLARAYRVHPVVSRAPAKVREFA